MLAVFHVRTEIGFMIDDDDFVPHLGHQRRPSGRSGRRYLGRVLAAANLARGGAAGAGRSNSAFTGTRIGRGAGIGRLLASRTGQGNAGARRVIVKARIVKLAGKGASAAIAHLRYLQRDGTTREGERGTLYGRESDSLELKEFHARGASDRHQFRFIVSPEDGQQYDDLKPLTRRLMQCMEEDLGTGLDWVAVDHFNTFYPHSHIIVRGRDERGKDLIIARDYLTRGIRERAIELVDLDLGPRTEREVAASLRIEVEQERLTSIDQALLKSADADHVVARHASDPFEQSLRAGRLAKLERLGFAEPVGAGRYRLDPELADTLRKLGERGDIIRTMQRQFSQAQAPGHGAAQIIRAPADQAIYNPAAPDARPLIGRLLARGLADEHADRHYLIVDGADGRAHYVAIGTAELSLGGVDGQVGEGAGKERTDREQTDRQQTDRERAARERADSERTDRERTDREGTGKERAGKEKPGVGEAGLARGAIIRIDPMRAEIRDVDRTIAAVAAANDGQYDIDAHLRHDPGASEAFAQTHVRRLEAMRRQGAQVIRAPSGVWTIAPDHLARVSAFEVARLQDRPVAIAVLSAHPLETQVAAEAATWIDRTLVGEDIYPIRDAGFGADILGAQARRRQWLLAQGFAQETSDGLRFGKGMIAALARRELLRVADALSGELDRPFGEAIEGERISGIYRRSIALVSGRFALIERARDFTLVPWRPALERQTGKAVSGLMRGDGINWSIGRGRSGPSIS
jgi:type IV secretory pathway VirD2 relaxase